MIQSMAAGTSTAVATRTVPAGSGVNVEAPA